MGRTEASAAQLETGSDGRPVKRRAACNECRTRKLKCTGEQPACSRCVKERITCVYSAQKQMGRPKKRQRSDEAGNANDTTRQGSGSSLQQLWDLSSNLAGRTDAGVDKRGFAGDAHVHLDMPWLDNQWNILPPSEHAIPGLTPDSSSNSPPTITLPLELHSAVQNSHQGHGHRDSSTHLLLDPSLTGVSSASNLGCPPGASPNCACLSSMYLTLNDLQSMDPSFTFPFALYPLREAMQIASEVLDCEECPRRFISEVQNTQLLGTLLMSIAERYSKVLESITSERIRAELACETKKFRLADLNTSTSHLHAGGLGCAAAFSVDLSPDEWRGMTKKVVRAEVYGPCDGNTCCPYLMDLTKRMEDRQKAWLDKPLPVDVPKDTNGIPMAGRYVKTEDHLCLKLVAFANKVVESYDWS